MSGILGWFGRGFRIGNLLVWFGVVVSGEEIESFYVIILGIIKSFKCTKDCTYLYSKLIVSKLLTFSEMILSILRKILMNLELKHLGIFE